MVLEHDFKKFPELANSQVDRFYWDSPHKQIFESFSAVCVKVIDGDTIRVLWDERDFDFPIRLLGIDAPELEDGGEEAQSFLEDAILGEKVDLIIDGRQRVGKWGRILAKVIHNGVDVGDELLRVGLATDFDRRKEGMIADIDTIIERG